MKQLGLAGAAGAITALIGNTLLYLAARHGLGLELVVPSAPASGVFIPLELSRVMLASVVPAVAATLLYALLGRFTAHPTRNFLAVAAVIGTLSLMGPLGLPAPLAQRLVLAGMHAISAVTITLALVGIPALARGRRFA